MKLLSILHSSDPDRIIIIKLFFIVLTACILINGARLASSDEIAVFRLAESIVENGALSVPPDTPNASAYEDRYFIWYEIGSTLLIIPFYLLGKIIVSILSLDSGASSLLLRAIVSLIGAIMGAFLGVLIYKLGRLFKFSIRIASFLTLALIFSTFLFPYLKSIIRDMIMAVVLTGTVYYLIRYRSEDQRNGYLLSAGILAGMGILVKITFLLYLPWLLMYAVITLRIKNWKSFAAIGIPLLFAAAVMGLYNFLRFGNLIDMGYHGGTSFPTPLFTGLFGLLLSPGKGFFWYAPLCLLLLWSLPPFFRKHRAEALLITALFLTTLFLHAKYFSWGGDGSWGPRYLVVILPLAVITIGEWLSRASVTQMRLAYALMLIGIIIQIGGVAVYQGNYLRKTGEYPFTRSFTDPEFMYRTHFIPNYSPITGHWLMLMDNLENHLRGNIPYIKPDPEYAGQRIPLDDTAKNQLLRTLDFWFMYALYAGYPAVPVALAVVLLTGIIFYQFFSFYRYLSQIHTRQVA